MNNNNTTFRRGSFGRGTERAWGCFLVAGVATNDVLTTQRYCRGRFIALTTLLFIITWSLGRHIVRN